MIVLGIGIAYAPNYTTFISLRFILGAVREVGYVTERDRKNET